MAWMRARETHLALWRPTVWARRCWRQVLSGELYELTARHEAALEQLEEAVRENGALQDAVDIQVGAVSA